MGHFGPKPIKIAWFTIVLPSLLLNYFGPGATGRSFSDPQLILRSIQSRLMGMPAATIVHTGHGDSTTIGAESALIAELIAQGEATSS